MSWKAQPNGRDDLLPSHTLPQGHGHAGIRGRQGWHGELIEPHSGGSAFRRAASLNTLRGLTLVHIMLVYITLTGQGWAPTITACTWSAVGSWIRSSCLLQHACVRCCVRCDRSGVLVYQQNAFAWTYNSSWAWSSGQRAHIRVNSKAIRTGNGRCDHPPASPRPDLTNEHPLTTSYSASSSIDKCGLWKSSGMRYWRTGSSKKMRTGKAIPPICKAAGAGGVDGRSALHQLIGKTLPINHKLSGLRTAGWQKSVSTSSCPDKGRVGISQHRCCSSCGHGSNFWLGVSWRMVR